MSKSVEKKLAHLSLTQKHILILDSMLKVAMQMYVKELGDIHGISHGDFMELLAVNVLANLKDRERETIDNLVSRNEEMAKYFVDVVLNSLSPKEYILKHPELLLNLH